ncbi:MAG: mitochondrial inner membrane protein required for protein import [Vezdaea aestivalis]|nr:MAG: mitochondrial inner membrane protein required for protein import [Vezdaea aestivalis]
MISLIARRALRPSAAASIILRPSFAVPSQPRGYAKDRRKNTRSLRARESSRNDDSVTRPLLRDDSEALSDSPKQEQFHSPNRSNAEEDEELATEPVFSQSQDTNSEPLSESTRPLPDLTKGIPSTLEFETKQHEDTSTKERHLTDPIVGGKEGVRKSKQGQKSTYTSSLDRKRRRYFQLMRYLAGALVISGTYYMGRDWVTEEDEERHRDAPSGWGPLLFVNRLSARWKDLIDWFTEPAFVKLLPDPHPDWARPHTLVISLEDMLVHQVWTREHGWRVAKRPGLDYFLRYLSQYYELVIWTSMPSYSAEPMLQKLDPFRIVMWRLCREATRYTNGENVKDLSFLNRDPSKIVMLDTSKAHTSAQPKNAIILPKWEGDPNDKELVSFIPFLEYLATLGGSDTRKVLASFQDTHIPTEYAARENRARNMLRRQSRDERGGRTPRSSGVGMLGSALGIKPQSTMYEGSEVSDAQMYDAGRLPQDIIRERAQKQYELIDKEIRENSEQWLAEIAREEEKMRQEGTRDFWSAPAGFLGFGKTEPQSTEEKKEKEKAEAKKGN